MAITPKNTKSTPAKKTEVINPVETVEPLNAEVATDIVHNAPVVDPEKEALEKQLEEMKAQMAFLMGQVSTQTKAEATPKKDRNIPIVNLTPGNFNLKGSQFWKLKGQFSQRVFLEREARIILNNMQNAIRSGMVYIADAQFVEENDLAETYQYLLSDEKLKTLLDNSSGHVIEIYKNASLPQQEIIIKMLVDKKQRGGNVDGNVLVELGKLSGKDLVNIEPEQEG